jgi:hypothetical protein
MFLLADALVKNSAVEFYDNGTTVKIKAKIIRSLEKLVKSEEVDATVDIPKYPSAVVKAKHLTFNPQSFECQVYDKISVIWGDWSIYTSHILFDVKKRTILGDVASEAYYKQWKFHTPLFLYDHDKKTVICQKGCEITDSLSFMKAGYGIAYLDKKFELSKGVQFKNSDYIVDSESMICFLANDNTLCRIDFPSHTKLSTVDGKVTLDGQGMVYENEKVVLHKVTSVISLS